METAEGGSASLTFGCKDHLSMPKHCKHHQHTLKIHPSQSFRLRLVPLTAQHESKFSPQRQHETIWFRNQAGFSLLPWDENHPKKREIWPHFSPFFTCKPPLPSPFLHSHIHLLNASRGLITSAEQMHTEVIQGKTVHFPGFCSAFRASTVNRQV